MNIDLKRMLAICCMALSLNVALADGDGDGDGGGDGGGGGSSGGGDSGGGGSSGSADAGSGDVPGAQEHDFLRFHLPLEFAAIPQGAAHSKTMVNAAAEGPLLAATRPQEAHPRVAKLEATPASPDHAPLIAASAPTQRSPLKFQRLLSDTQDDVAVIIENANYREKSIPANLAASNDARDFRQFATDALGISTNNIIHLKDATKAQLLKVFGSEKRKQGQLADWIRSNKSRVYIYYAGHGAPSDDADSYLVPSDADSTYLELNGYPISTLYTNLASLPARHVTVVLESCFSGVSQSGAIVTRASPLFLKPKHVVPPAQLTVLSAARQNQIASWEKSEPRSLFTKYFLEAMAGKADLAPYGDGDGQVNAQELNTYLKETVSYWAKRYYGRNQDVMVQNWSLR